MKRSPRHIVALLCLGLLAVTTLALIPYSLTESLERRESAATIVSAVATDAAAAGKATTAAAVEPVFDAAVWYAERNEAPETHGLLIESLNHEKLFASHNADVVFNPASLIKLATSLVALKKLGADYRFRTQVYADGKVDEQGTFRGLLYFMGSDPTFGDAGAGMIAAELRSRGIKRLQGGVMVSPDFCFNFSESPEDSAARLGRALRLGDVTTGVAGGTSGTRLFAVASHPLRDVLLYMNARSSNFMAERIGAVIGGPGAVQQFLINELKLPSQQVTIARVSGREHNRMTPRGLLTVIRALVEEAARQGLRPEDIMPVASDDAGTLRRRLAGTGLEGAVVGKTGTLTSEVDGGMASLAGIVYTYDKGMIVFAILDKGNRIWDNRQMEDQLLSEVINSQASPLAVAGEVTRQLLPSSNLRLEK
ncbi:MAG TPA: D-alanyl-D-alanine carboxypeptidase [Pyrinomonadaceae bacterium]|nr:D-alanyl-D-alanine carboxypeptidase [Pyrinomonadaceae bacterium]